VLLVGRSGVAAYWLSSFPSSPVSLQIRCGTLRSHALPEQEGDDNAVSTKEFYHQETLLSMPNPILSDDDYINGASDDFRLRFAGVGRLYANTGDESSSTEDTVMARLARAVVAVVGLGGVGSWAAEALCRSGVGNLVLIDLDDLCLSNTNRQLHALTSTVGRLKIEEMKRRLLDINPHCSITLVHDFVTTDNAHDLLKNLHLTALLDAIDGSKEKAALLAACCDMGISVITTGGAAGRKDPTKIVCEELTVATGDKLLATVRKDLRKHYGFKPGLPFYETQKGKKVKPWGIDCVYSTEEPKGVPSGSIIDTGSLRRCDSALGTACFVTGAFGFAAAGRVVDMIAHNELVQPSGNR
jgi:tRNA A37 threonylcarbamoyladenosine dehydratase